MAIFNPTTPFELDLSLSEESQRNTSIAATGSPSPVPFACITPVPAIYTHVGHAAQYGAGRRNGRTVRLVILHVTDVDGSALGAAAYDARRPDSVSATAFIGPQGEIVYDVPEKDRPYTTGRWNDESVTCEIVGKAAWTDAQWRARPDQLEAIVRIIVDWCKRYSLPAQWLTANEVAVGASPEGTPPIQGFNYGVTDHYTANQAAIALGGSPLKYSHTCVGPALRAIVMNELIPEAARRMTANPPASGEDEMILFTHQDPRYANVFVRTTSSTFTVTGEEYTAAPVKDVPHFNKEAHNATLFAYMREAHLKAADMVQIGGQPAAPFPDDLK